MTGWKEEQVRMDDMMKGRTSDDGWLDECIFYLEPSNEENELEEKKEWEIDISSSTALENLNQTNQDRYIFQAYDNILQTVLIYTPPPPPPLLQSTKKSLRSLNFFLI